MSCCSPHGSWVSSHEPAQPEARILLNGLGFPEAKEPGPSDSPSHQDEAGLRGFAHMLV